MYIPRTQMTRVLLGKGIVLWGCPSKIEVIGALGGYIMYISFSLNKGGCCVWGTYGCNRKTFGSRCWSLVDVWWTDQRNRNTPLPGLPEKKNIDNDKDVPHHESNGIFTKESSRCYYFYFLQLEIWVISSQQHVRFLEGNFSCNLLELLCVISHVYPLTCVKIAKMIYWCSWAAFCWLLPRIRKDSLH